MMNADLSAMEENYLNWYFRGNATAIEINRTMLKVVDAFMETDPTFDEDAFFDAFRDTINTDPIYGGNNND